MGSSYDWDRACFTMDPVRALVCNHVCVLCMFVYMGVRVRVYARTCIHVYMSVHVHMCVCVCACSTVLLCNSVVFVVYYN